MHNAEVDYSLDIFLDHYVHWKAVFFLFLFQVTSAALTSLHRSGMEGQLMDMMQFPVYFEYENGIVGRVYTIENDSIFCTNIKKGIISMFQVQTEQGERMEVSLCIKLCLELFWFLVPVLEQFIQSFMCLFTLCMRP